MSEKVRFEVVGKKTIEEENGKGFLGYHYWDPKEETHVLELPPKVSTGTRLHELGHAYLGHKGFAGTVGEMAHRELDAEEWARKITGKDLNLNELGVVAAKAYDEVGYNTKPSAIFRYAKRLAEEYGIELDESSKDALWDYIMKIYRIERAR